MRVVLTGNFTDLTGKDSDTNLGKVLANMLASAQKGNAIKFYDWAIKLFNDGEIEIDEADRKVLEKFISESGASMAVQSQLLKAFDRDKK